MKGHAVLLAVFAPLLAGACTVIGHQKVEGWPQLAVSEHYVPHWQMRDHCAKYAPFGSSPEACAVFNLEARVCDLWFSADFPPPRSVVEHERMHCEGYDHIGETGMRDFLARYNASRALTPGATPAPPRQAQSAR